MYVAEVAMAGVEDIQRTGSSYVAYADVVALGVGNNLRRQRAAAVAVVDGYAAQRRLILFCHDDVFSSILVHVPNRDLVDINHVRVNCVLDPGAISPVRGCLPPDQASRSNCSVLG